MSAEFGKSLIQFGQHLVKHPTLPAIYTVHQASAYDGGGLELRLYSAPVRGARELAAWAATLDDATSYARRITEDQVDGHVVGLIAGCRIEVIAVLPPDLFPSEGRQHEWDVSVQLREA